MGLLASLTVAGQIRFVYADIPTVVTDGLVVVELLRTVLIKLGTVGVQITLGPAMPVLLVALNGTAGTLFLGGRFISINRCLRIISSIRVFALGRAISCILFRLGGLNITSLDFPDVPAPTCCTFLG